MIDFNRHNIDVLTGDYLVTLSEFLCCRTLKAKAEIVTLKARMLRAKMLVGLPATMKKMKAIAYVTTFFGKM